MTAVNYAFTSGDASPVIIGAVVTLRVPTPDDWPLWRAVRITAGQLTMVKPLP